MNEQQKLEGNMACANICGFIKVECDTDQYGYKFCNITRDYNQSWEDFDIFTNDSQCLEVVKRLGEVHGIAIIPFVSGINCKPVGWFWHKAATADESSCLKTIQEAVAAAAIEVMK